VEYDELLRQRLYRIFRIEDENYMYTMKVFYVYRQVEKTEGERVLDAITEMRQACKKRKNTERLDAIFRQLQAVNLAHIAAPPGARPPTLRQEGYYSGWKIG
jgi:hypothetical protein